MSNVVVLLSMPFHMVSWAVTIMVKVKYKAWYIVVKFENNPLRIVGNIKLLVIFTFGLTLNLTLN